ncbi:hypothetical protein [Paenibacillus aceti]|uniref:hypothetical protein n=1 Tax=Paenibacillus aceti TaxID=1820010 RepID=UPI001E29EC88|nr:hypothetical protein [Paenibacillus aceti]
MISKKVFFIETLLEAIIRMQISKPYNPGLSEKAWNKLHKMLAALNIKYAAEIQASRKAKQEKAM